MMDGHMKCGTKTLIVFGKISLFGFTVCFETLYFGLKVCEEGLGLIDLCFAGRPRDRMRHETARLL